MIKPKGINRTYNSHSTKFGSIKVTIITDDPSLIPAILGFINLITFDNSVEHWSTGSYSDIDGIVRNKDIDYLITVDTTGDSAKANVRAKDCALESYDIPLKHQ